MLAKRIIPCLDVKEGRVVKGVNFINLVDAGDPAENGRFYDEEGADELTFLDITASSDKRNIIIDMVKRVAGQVHIPFTVGGGIRTIDDIRLILENGADKVSINTAAFKTPELIEEAARLFGSQCIVAAIDAKENAPEGNWNVYLNGGRTRTDIDAVAWALRVQELGAGEILLTSMDRDGTKDGYDLKLTKAVAERVRIPVIASGGAGSVKDIYAVLTEGKADAALVASILHFKEITIRQIKEQLSSAGLTIRPV